MRTLCLLLLTSLTAACPTMPYGDLNCDGRVDLADLAILAENWLRTFEMSYPNKVQVTGITDPGTAGIYQYYAEFEEYTNVYLSPDRPGVVLFFETEEDNKWLMGIPGGEGSSAYWLGSSENPEDPTGTYEPLFGTTGTATVTELSGSLAMEPITYQWVDDTMLMMIAGTVTGSVGDVTYTWHEYVDGSWTELFSSVGMHTIALTDRDQEETYLFRLTVTDEGLGNEETVRFLTVGMSYPDKIQVSGNSDPNLNGIYTRTDVDIDVAGKHYLHPDGHWLMRDPVGEYFEGIDIWMLVYEGGGLIWVRSESENYEQDAVFGPENLLGTYYPYMGEGSHTGTATVAEYTAAPSITAVVDGGDVVVSINGDAGATHTVWYKLTSDSDWTVGGTRTNDGDITLTDPGAGTYQIIAYSTIDGVISPPSNLIVLNITSLSNIEAAFYSLLYADVAIAGIVEGRISPMMLCQTDPVPAITYQQLTGSRNHTLLDTGNMVDAMFQVNCYTQDYGTGRTLADAVRACLDSYAGTIGGVVIQKIMMESEGDIISMDDDLQQTQVFGKRLSFRVFFNE